MPQNSAHLNLSGLRSIFEGAPLTEDQWYVNIEYQADKFHNYITIYTIPYPCNGYTLLSQREQFQLLTTNPSTTTNDLYQRVRILTMRSKGTHHYFSHIHTLQCQQNLNLSSFPVAVEEILLEQVSRVIPHKVITLKPRDKIWFSDDLRVLHKDKVRMYRKMISKPTLVNKNNYEQAVVKFRKACVQAKVEFYKKINHKVSVSSKNWWSLVKHTMGRDRTTAIPALKDKNGDVRVDVQSKVEILNAHFANICTWSGYSNFSSVADKLPLASSRLSVFTATYRDVRKILQRLNCNKSTAPTITNRMLRYLEPSITQCLTHLIRVSFSTTSFPDHWKGGYVNALFKSGDTLDPTNYRPITLLPAISK
ncbi:unnamed protein product, partial [Didymodactylos carnosus]